MKSTNDVFEILEGTVGAVEPEWYLTRIDFNGGQLWLQDKELPIGSSAKVQLHANDISLATSEPSPSSIQNILHGKVVGFEDDGQLASILVKVQVGTKVFMSRITRRALMHLDIQEGNEVWAQIKAVALVD